MNGRRSRLLFAVACGGGIALGVGAVGVGACIPDVAPDPSTLPRCRILDGGCGDGGDDCCASDPVKNGVFLQLDDGSLSANVDGFHLDRYEVTVGRFRAFYAGYALDKPQQGDGQSPHLGPTSGWMPAWNSSLPAQQSDLSNSLKCDANYATWTDDPGPNEDKPINCVSWYVAFAFCAWDGGRLPTAAEWNYAATGGNQQLQYPWGDAAPDPTLAVFGCPGTAALCVIPNVGSTPAGQGVFHQMDLAGSMAEWTLDYYGKPEADCTDKCVNLDYTANGRDLRGGDFTHDQTQLATTFHIGVNPSELDDYVGFRCARDP